MTASRYEWDAAKAASNLARHGVPFDAVHGFDWSRAIEAEDTRYDYGETRLQALGRVGARYRVLVYPWRAGRIRVISLRKANQRKVP